MNKMKMFASAAIALLGFVTSATAADKPNILVIWEMI